MPPHPASASQVDQLVAIELLVADLYAWLGVVLVDDIEASTFFACLSDEERDHAALLRSYEKHRPVDLEPIKAMHDLAEYDSLRIGIESFKKQHPSPELGEAVRFSLGLEEDHADDCTAMVEADVNTDTKRLLKMLAEQDMRHCQMLRAFGDSRKLLDAPTETATPS